MVRIVEISYDVYEELDEFFQRIKDNRFFHPHPFTLEEAYTRCFYSGKDLYYVLIDDAVIAYGMVRGIGEWKTPCLGIYVAGIHRRKGAGETLVRFLHLVGRLQGIERLRLHVHPDNKRAITLYEKLGYEFIGTRENGELIGFKGL